MFVQEYLKRMAPYQEEIEQLKVSAEFTEGDPSVVEHYFKTIFRAYSADPQKVEQLNLRLSSFEAVRGFQISKLFRELIQTKPVNLHPELEKVTVPTLVIHGDADVIPPCTAESISKSLPNAKYVLLESCGHFPYIEQEEAFFDHVNHFLKQTTHRVCQLENEQVKVWKTVIMPHEPLKMHRHDAARVVVGLKGGTLQKIEESGEVSDLVFETGKAYWLDADPEGELHGDVNLSDEPIEVMVIEFKKERRD